MGLLSKNWRQICKYDYFIEPGDSVRVGKHSKGDRVQKVPTQLDRSSLLALSVERPRNASHRIAGAAQTPSNAYKSA